MSRPTYKPGSALSRMLAWTRKQGSKGTTASEGAHRLGLSISTANSTMSKLSNDGWLKRIPRGGESHQGMMVTLYVYEEL